MVRSGIALLAAMCVSQSVSAQTTITIDNHRQKAACANEAEWPTVSAQQHWAPANDVMFDLGSDTSDVGATDLLNPVVAHQPLDCSGPFYGEIAGPFPLYSARRQSATPVNGSERPRKKPMSVSGSLVTPSLQFRFTYYFSPACTGTSS